MVDPITHHESVKSVKKLEQEEMFGEGRKTMEKINEMKKREGKQKINRRQVSQSIGSLREN